jgi:hypothetical protein
VVNGTFNLRVNPTDFYSQKSEFFVGDLEGGYIGNHVWRTTWSPVTKPSRIVSATLVFNTSRAAPGLQILVNGANADNKPEDNDGNGAYSTSSGKTGSVTVAAPASTATPLSIDVTTIVSAIVGRAGWTPGNSIEIYLFGVNATSGMFWQPNPVTGQGIGTLTIQWQDTPTSTPTPTPTTTQTQTPTTTPTTTITNTPTSSNIPVTPTTTTTSTPTSSTIGVTPTPTATRMGPPISPLSIGQAFLSNIHTDLVVDSEFDNIRIGQTFLSNIHTDTVAENEFENIRIGQTFLSNIYTDTVAENEFDNVRIAQTFLSNIYSDPI